MNATSRFIVSNPLHPDVFPGMLWEPLLSTSSLPDSAPGIRKMEAEIVSMCLNLFNNPHGAGTSMSTSRHFVHR